MEILDLSEPEPIRVVHGLCQKGFVFLAPMHWQKTTRKTSIFFSESVCTAVRLEQMFNLLLKRSTYYEVGPYTSYKW